MEAEVERSNLWQAYERVLRNKGAAGVDGLTVFELKAWLQQHWPSVKAALLAGDYLPAAIRKVALPKPNGGVRILGIPTVLDRRGDVLAAQNKNAEARAAYTEALAKADAQHPLRAIIQLKLDALPPAAS